MTANIPLSRILQEIQLDGQNLRAMFRFHRAQSEWFDILAPIQEAPTTEGEIAKAGTTLSAALQATENPRERLRMLAALIKVVDLVDGDVGGTSASSTKALTPEEQARNDAIEALRHKASVAVAEQALCEINRALFEPASLVPCPLPSDPQPPSTGPVRPQCDGAAWSSFWRNPQNTFPGDLSRGLKRILSALALPASSGTSQPLRARTQCELTRLAHADFLRRLGLPLVGYVSVVRFMADGRAAVPAEQAASVLRDALETAELERLSRCPTTMPSCTSAKLLQQMKSTPQAQATPPIGMPAATLEKWRKEQEIAAKANADVAQAFQRYCQPIFHGNEIWQSAKRTESGKKGGLSLFVRTRSALHPDDAKVETLGEFFETERNACVK